jgi:hypothetical protein
MTGTISLIGWERFQHYKDRDPPWVKLYRDLLTTESWVLGTDCSRLVQVASVLLAARYENKIPYRWSLIKKVASLDCSEREFSAAIAHLIEYKFLEVHEVTNTENPVAQSASTALAKCSSETETETETEQRRISVAQERDAGPAERVFAHWRAEFGHPRAHLDAKRRKAIAAALARYDEATVCAAISGYKHSPHHMGQNERHTVYDDIELFLRDAKHIEAGLNFARGPPLRQKSAVEQARERLLNGNGNGRAGEQFGQSCDAGMGEVAGALRRLAAS